MSAYTTLKISRAKALELVLRELATIDNCDLADWVDEIVAPRLYRVQVDDYFDPLDNNDDRL